VCSRRTTRGVGARTFRSVVEGCVSRNIGSRARRRSTHSGRQSRRVELHPRIGAQRPHTAGANTSGQLGSATDRQAPTGRSLLRLSSPRETRTCGVTAGRCVLLGRERQRPAWRRDSDGSSRRSR
jgi:hypothetical protein